MVDCLGGGDIFVRQDQHCWQQDTRIGTRNNKWYSSSRLHPRFSTNRRQQLAWLAGWPTHQQPLSCWQWQWSDQADTKLLFWIKILQQTWLITQISNMMPDLWCKNHRHCTVNIDVVLVQKKINFFAFEKNQDFFSNYPTIFWVEKTLLETFFPIPPLKGFLGPP